MGSKFCFSCKMKKPKTDFGKASGRPDGCSVYCKICTSKKSAESYAKTAITKKCVECGKEFIGTKNARHCSSICEHSKNRKGIDGYHACQMCNKLFPYRKSLKVRCVRNSYGEMVASIKQKYCSISCVRDAMRERNKIWKPTEEMKRKTSERMSKLHKGKKLSEETRRKMSLAQKGEKSHFWKGGIAPINKVIRHSIEIRLWREAVFRRDNFTCQACGTRGVELNADHIRPFALYPELRTSIENGRTLCVPCHKMTDTYAGKGTIRRISASLGEYPL